jgi:hypothetical protein
MPAPVSWSAPTHPDRPDQLLQTQSPKRVTLLCRAETVDPGAAFFLVGDTFNAGVQFRKLRFLSKNVHETLLILYYQWFSNIVLFWDGFRV